MPWFSKSKPSVFFPDDTGSKVDDGDQPAQNGEEVEANISFNTHVSL